MKRITIFLILLIYAPYAVAEDSIQNICTISAHRVIKTGDKLGLTQKITAFAETIGGYFIFQNNKKVSLKIPVDFVDSTLAFLDSSGLVLEKGYQRDDVTDVFWQHISKINAKSALLKDFIKMLENAGDTGIFAVEQSVISLQKEIEEEQGKVNKIRHRAQYADVEVRFELSRQRTPLVQGNSDFPWLNDINLPGLIQDYTYGR